MTKVTRDEADPTSGIEITLSTGEKVIIPLERALGLIELLGSFPY